MSSVDEIKQLLAEHEFFKGIPPEYLARLTPHVILESFPAGEYVFRAGGQATHCYLIRQGQVALEVFEPHRGGSIVLHTIDRHGVLGCSWLVPPYQWRFDARATQLTRMLAIDAAAFRDALEADHEFGYEIIKRFLAVFTGRLSAVLLQMSDMYA
ncbi:MAG TPA: cyclic nucleotide-binding domain-containing protein [Candidatus Hydrogenedentes bacterium]|nr:cyclic nucleotide-binding domain-containing protein [Candidatus Hydrogenedentota bacterium]